MKNHFKSISHYIKEGFVVAKNTTVWWLPMSVLMSPFMCMFVFLKSTLEDCIDTMTSTCEDTTNNDIEMQLVGVDESIQD